MSPSQKPENLDPPERRTGDGHKGESWPERCGRLFEEMRRPARAMVARAYGRALNDDEIEDVYSAAWAATLSALRERGRRMEEGELRAYILTAVASHASKEMRRRSRKPMHPLEAEREQAVIDGHAALPDELALGSEARGIARDLLTSLPVRRRAVMLLRYGWGLSPKEVCALVPGLSPRAYRKEITRGVEDLMAGLGKVESGEWCADREPLIRDLLAGTADDAARRQALEHLGHCRACSDLAARLSRELHEIGGVVALGAVAGCIGGNGLPLVQRLSDVVGTVKTAVANVAERAESTASALLASGGTKGSGVAGAGFAAKLAGAGGGAKAVLACLGAGAAATACVAAGVVPGLSLRDLDPVEERRAIPTQARRDGGHPVKPRTAIASVIEMSRAVGARRADEPEQVEPPAPPMSEGQPAAPSQPVEEVAAPAPVEEFDPVAAGASSAAPAAPGSSSAQAPPTGSGSSPTSAAENEFGP